MLIQVFRYLYWGLISSNRLGDWKYIQSVKSACSMLYLELQTSILPSLSRELIKNIKWTQTIASKMLEQLHYIHEKYNKSASQFMQLEWYVCNCAIIPRILFWCNHFFQTFQNVIRKNIFIWTSTQTCVLYKSICSFLFKYNLELIYVFSEILL